MKGFSCVSADLKGDDGPEILCRQDKLLLALGNEASGLSKSMLNTSNSKVRIPIVQKKAESLNVAVCGAICMYLSSRKQ
jgi:tRNA G18 (ribose-2'-O)-methylase SpoU